MLVLTRKPGESIMIGDAIEITILHATPTKVRVGIKAPHDLPVVRPEAHGEPDSRRRTPTRSTQAPQR